MTEIDSDSRTQEAVRNLFVGIAPERSDELELLWRDYAPTFNVLEEVVGRKGVVMRSGPFDIVEFNGRAQRAFWLGTFMAWESHRGLSQWRVETEVRSRYPARMHRTFQTLLDTEDPYSVAMPEGVPEPELFPNLVGETKLVADVAAFAIGWSLLHEIGHLKHKHDGTATGAEDPRCERHREELSCDEFATTFLLEQVEHFAYKESTDPRKVRGKREMGVYAALFVIALAKQGAWDESESHPAMQTRIDRVVKLMCATGERVSDSLARDAFDALGGMWRHAPRPVWPRQ